MNSARTYFFALRPDGAFAARLLGYKRRVAELVGPQLHLEDPPHLTLYLASFAGAEGLVHAGAKAAAGAEVPAVRLAGWHVFAGDQVTGNNTLVCDLDLEDSDSLRPVQQAVVEATAGLRDREVSRARYQACWQRLSEEERANVERTGFPFAGSNWHPHLSVASIAPDDWEAVWDALAGDPPAEVVEFGSLDLFALEGARPVLLARFPLTRVPCRV
jgi:2'-5' RNA ligase